MLYIVRSVEKEIICGKESRDLSGNLTRAWCYLCVLSILNILRSDSLVNHFISVTIKSHCDFE